MALQTRYAATVANISTIGSDQWMSFPSGSSPPSAGDLTAEDSVFAYCAFNGELNEISNYLRCTNFGFSIPTTSSVSGVVLGIRRRATAYVFRDYRIRLVKANSIQTTDKKDTSIGWPTTTLLKTYGADNDLWGGSWTPADINGSGFGCALAVEEYTSAGAENPIIDEIYISVYYGAPIDVDPDTASPHASALITLEIPGPADFTLSASAVGSASAAVGVFTNPSDYGASLEIEPMERDLGYVEAIRPDADHALATRFYLALDPDALFAPFSGYVLMQIGDGTIVGAELCLYNPNIDPAPPCVQIRTGEDDIEYTSDPLPLGIPILIEWMVRRAPP